MKISSTAGWGGSCGRKIINVVIFFAHKTRVYTLTLIALITLVPFAKELAGQISIEVVSSFRLPEASFGAAGGDAVGQNYFLGEHNLYQFDDQWNPSGFAQIALPASDMYGVAAGGTGTERIFTSTTTGFIYEYLGGGAWSSGIAIPELIAPVYDIAYDPTNDFLFVSHDGGQQVGLIDAGSFAFGRSFNIFQDNGATASGLGYLHEINALVTSDGTDTLGLFYFANNTAGLLNYRPATVIGSDAINGLGGSAYADNIILNQGQVGRISENLYATGNAPLIPEPAVSALFTGFAGLLGTAVYRRFRATQQKHQAEK